MQSASTPAIPAAALLPLIQQLDEEAWGQIQGDVFRHVFTAIKNTYHSLSREDLEDLVQETMLRLLQNARNLESSRLPAWILTVAWNAGTDAIRKYLRHPQKGTECLEQESAITESPYSSAERDELNANLRRCLGNLSEKQRAVVLLKYCEELTNAEIAAALNIKEGYVGRILFDAKQELAEHLNRAGVEGTRHIRPYNKKNKEGSHEA
jgi:RNA polymerase sigma-70 factor (ECF subfamily)